MASWMLGEQGADIRQPVVDELARLIDTAVAGESSPSHCAQSLGSRMHLITASKLCTTAGSIRLTAVID